MAYSCSKNDSHLLGNLQHCAFRPRTGVGEDEAERMMLNVPTLGRPRLQETPELKCSYTVNLSRGCLSF